MGKFKMQAVCLPTDAVAMAGADFDALMKEADSWDLARKQMEAMFGDYPQFTVWVEDYAKDFPHAEREGVRNALNNAYIAGFNHGALSKGPPPEAHDDQA